MMHNCYRQIILETGFGVLNTRIGIHHGGESVSRGQAQGIFIALINKGRGRKEAQGVLVCVSTTNRKYAIEFFLPKWCVECHDFS